MPQIEWQRVLPVLISIGVVIGIAVGRQFSRTFAVIASTMPLNVAFGIFIIGSAADPREDLAGFILGLIIALIPTYCFLFAAYFAARAGWHYLAVLGVGYLTWGVILMISLWVQRQFG